VYLQNGYHTEETEFGEATAVEHQKDLHMLIGHGVINTPDSLSGVQLRFLRVELGMSQKLLGSFLGYNDGQMFARWEKEETPIPRAADVVVRALYRERILNNDNGIPANVSGTLDMLKDNDATDFHQRRLELTETDGQWAAAA
jgi:DNA-binding transcriptional regulator YiaG